MNKRKYFENSKKKIQLFDSFSVQCQRIVINGCLNFPNLTSSINDPANIKNN